MTRSSPRGWHGRVVAVTPHLEADEVAEPALRDALLGERLLLARQRDADDVAAEGLGRADREPAPANADVEQRVVRLRTMQCDRTQWHVAWHGRFVFDSARRAGRGSFRFLFCLLLSSDQRSRRATRALTHTLRIASHTHRPTDRPTDRPTSFDRS